MQHNNEHMTSRPNLRLTHQLSLTNLIFSNVSDTESGQLSPIMAAYRNTRLFHNEEDCTPLGSTLFNFADQVEDENESSLNLSLPLQLPAEL